MQLKRLPEFFAKRTQNAKMLTQKLEKFDKLVLPPKITNGTHSWYLYTVRIKNITREQRDKIIKQMHDKGIGAEAYYPTPVHQMPYYEKFGKLKLPETETAAKQVLSLPIHPSVSEEQIDWIAQSLLELI